jgi:uncharacterized membrane protein YgdD (TMEM256/DUF423 family)
MKHQTGGETWMEVVDQAARYCLTHDLGLLVVDVWGE